MFRDVSDRSHMRDMLQYGDIIAIINPKPDNPVVIAAITYIDFEDAVLITYLGTNSVVRNCGIGQLLLILVGKITIMYDNKYRHRVIYLATNQKKNPEATKWYVKRGFKRANTSKEKQFRELIENLPDRYEDEDLICLCLKDFANSYKIPDIAEGMIVRPRLYTYPFLDDIDTVQQHVYAQFPHKFPMASSHHCMDDNNMLDLSVFKNDIASPKKYLPETRWNYSQVTWADRCLVPNPALSENMITMALSWFQREQSSTLFSERLTLVPPEIARDHNLMYQTYMRFEQRKSELLSEVAQEGDNDIYNPEFDDEFFMKKAITVVEYVFANKCLFLKPYIAMVTTGLENGFTFLAINADKVDTNEGPTPMKKRKPLPEAEVADQFMGLPTIPSVKKHNGLVHGYIYWDPAMEQTTEIEEPHCLFFEIGTSSS